MNIIRPIVKDSAVPLNSELTYGLHLWVWSGRHKNWVDASYPGLTPSTQIAWAQTGFTHYCLASKRPSEKPGVVISDADGLVAMSVQQDAQSRFTFRNGWDGLVVLTAAELGILKGRELERAHYEERLKRCQETIDSLHAQVETRCKPRDSGELAALRIECNGLRTRLELVRQALVKPI